ncbi:hypothetical protein ACFRH4_43265 [Streptomyces mirabilis]|uniref:hypothetical protein n=1 Tax=Streptomyces mirabilis TaxID=68239 RepID=UPI00367F7C4B
MGLGSDVTSAVADSPSTGGSASSRFPRGVSGAGDAQAADFLRAAELEPVERAALDHGVTVRRGQGYTLRVSAVPAVHRQLLARCQPLDGQFTGTGMRRYEQRITEAARITAGRWDGYARTGQTLDIGQEMRRFALDGIWRSLTGYPLDGLAAGGR